MNNINRKMDSEVTNQSIPSTDISIKTKPSEPLTTVEEIVNNDLEINLQKLEEKAKKAEEALEKEEKLRKELETLNSKLLAEKTALLDSLAGEKGSLSEFQERTAKLQAQKADLDNQLRVSSIFFIPEYFSFAIDLFSKKIYGKKVNRIIICKKKSETSEEEILIPRKFVIA